MLHPISKIEVIKTKRIPSAPLLDLNTVPLTPSSNSCRPRSSPVRVPWLGELKADLNSNNLAQLALSITKDSENYRPKTSITCDCISEVFGEPVRRHNFRATLSQRRARSAAVHRQKTSQVPKEAYTVGPGYTVYKSSDKIAVRINTDKLFGDVPTVETARKVVNEELEQKDAFTEQLQNQINDLSLFLEEEKLAHKETTERCAEELSRTINEWNQQFSTEMQSIKHKHEKELENVFIAHSQEISEEKSRRENVEKKLHEELDFVHASFETYKQSLDAEAQESWAKRETEMLVAADKKLSEKLDLLKEELHQDFAMEKEDIEEDHKKQLEKTQKDFQKQIQSMQKKYADVQATMNELKDKTDRLKEAEMGLQASKEENKELNEKIEAFKSNLQLKKTELETARYRIREFEQAFDAKVDLIDEKYKKQIENLKLESLDLKRTYIKKCNEIIELKKLNNRQVEGSLETAKDAMQTVINTRNRIQASIAGLNEEEDVLEKLPFSRRLSAPVTDRERLGAIQMAGETNQEEF